MAWTFGVDKILSGAKAADGGMGQTLTEHDETLKGSVTLESTDPTINWIETEEKGKRLAISQNDGETTLTFEVANPSLETQAYYLGGQVKTEGGKKYFAPPKSGQVVEKSFRLVTKDGYNVEIPNGKVTATPLSGQIGTDNVMTMKVVVSVQEPEKEGVDKIRYIEK